jgi:hypothetical protein
VLSSDPEGPVVRHRWRAFEEALGARDIVLEVVEWPKDLEGRRHAMHRAETADGVVVSSRLLRPADTSNLRRRARRLALDLDDALCYRDTTRGAKVTWTRRRRFRRLAREADRVFVGNDYLAALALRAGGTVDVLPTVVRVPDAAPAPEPPLPPPVLGWIGSSSTLPYLAAEWVILSALVASGRPFRLRVIADAAPSMPPGIAVEAVPWTLNGWREALSGIHIGLAPLPDDPWTRGKCGLKVLQMMSVGRPVVASAVGVQKAQVIHAKTGFLASTREAFLDGLVALLDDPDLRAEMGRAGLETVSTSWSVETWAPRVVTAVERWLG